MNITDEFSFILKPSSHGVGVFAVHDIKKDTPMRVFADNNPRRLLKKESVPELFREYCADRGSMMICPPDFGYLPLGWYMNHSSQPNTEPRGAYTEETGYRFFAIRDILAEEEITIDYNLLEEPEDSKQSYYAQ